MTDPGKDTESLADKANELAAKAMTAAAPIAAQAAERAKEFATQAAAAAGPLAAQAKEKAEELLDRAGPTIAKSVSAAAESLDHATGGKYSDRISAVTSKIEERLDPKPGVPDVTPPDPSAPPPAS